MLLSFELISGLAIGLEFFFPDNEKAPISSIRGVVFHLAIFRFMIMWGFSNEQ